jgi:benzodiazapine receptor
LYGGVDAVGPDGTGRDRGGRENRAMPRLPFPRRSLRPIEPVLFLIPLAVGGATGALTAGPIRGWYRTLTKPSFTPPDAVFGPVWTALYAAMGVSLVLVRRAADRGAEPDQVRLAGAAFATQLALNAAWSLLFFNAHAIDAALVEIVLLWLAIAVTIAAFARVRPAAGLVLVPYLAWVSFAAALNAGIRQLNA